MQNFVNFCMLGRLLVPDSGVTFWKFSAGPFISGRAVRAVRARCAPLGQTGRTSNSSTGNFCFRAGGQRPAGPQGPRRAGVDREGRPARRPASKQPAAVRITTSGSKASGASPSASGKASGLASTTPHTAYYRPDTPNRAGRGGARLDQLGHSHYLGRPNRTADTSNSAGGGRGPAEPAERRQGGTIVQTVGGGWARVEELKSGRAPNFSTGNPPASRPLPRGTDRGGVGRGGPGAGLPYFSFHLPSTREGTAMQHRLKT